MLTKNEKSFTVIFILLVVLERITDLIPSLNGLYYLAKPLIVLSLIVYFIKNSSHLNKNTKNFTVLALVFSLLGDVLLMFQNNSPNFFISGLAAFLTAHIFYSVLFNTIRDTHKKPFTFISILLIYAVVLFSLFKDNLGEMLIPVLLYIIVILIMATMAFLRKNIIKSSYNWVLLGAIIFMLSDSTIAINKFYTSLSAASTAIMLTYALAQYLIVFGILKQQD